MLNTYYVNGMLTSKSTHDHSIFTSPDNMLLINYFVRSWRKNLRKHVKDPEKQIDIYQLLHIMLDEQCESTFLTYLQSFLEKYKSDEPTFTQYFEEYYARRSGILLVY